MEHGAAPSLEARGVSAPHGRPAIASERLLVRPLRPDDGADLFAYLSQAEVYRFEPGEPVGRTEASRLAEERSLGSSFLALELRTEGRVVGHLSWHPVEPGHLRTWELGFIVDPRFQRRGLATEGARAWVEHAFESLAVHRVVAHCHPDNVASWKTLERIGFVREGHLRKNVFFRSDAAGQPAWQDTLLYAMLSEDRWPVSGGLPR
jgi:RimJ/RimL family protein N-acetyltransferase